jgi:peptidoglycan/LPS O-acetylase OafA/YrhL
LWDGESAVLIFFLLSGYVLALQLGSPDRPTYSAYLVRRFFRIWPTFAVSVAIGYLLLNWANLPPLDAKSNRELTVPTITHLLENLLMVGDPHAIDPPAWSLYVEIRLSVVFPALLLLTHRLGLIRATLASLVLSVLLSRLVHWDLPSVLLSLAESARFLVLFVIGAALAKPGNPIELLYKQAPWPLKLSTLAIALLCLALQFAPMDLPGPVRAYTRWVGGCALFIFCLYSPLASTALDRKGLRFLGSVSYGLYLLHYPIMRVVEQHMERPWSTAVVLLLSLTGGWIIHFSIERPMIKWGRKLSARFGNAQPIASGSMPCN